MSPEKLKIIEQFLFQGELDNIVSIWQRARETPETSNVKQAETGWEAQRMHSKNYVEDEKQSCLNEAYAVLQRRKKFYMTKVARSYARTMLVKENKY